jgi:hypothetical protein
MKSGIMKNDPIPNIKSQVEVMEFPFNYFSTSSSAILVFIYVFFG